MQVIVPKTSGFCPGVKRAEDSVFKLKETLQSVNLYGPLIHNKNYIKMLEDNNIKAVDIEALVPGASLVIRTHGIAKNEEDLLSQKFILKDLTCPIVKRVQKHVEKASDQGFFLIISGKKNHAEVKGLVSYAQNYIVIENEAELDHFFENHDLIIPKNIQKIFILSQTTHSRDFFTFLSEKVQSFFQDFEIIIKDTICAVTENKEKEALDLQRDVDFTVVIGDNASSNSKKLYEILKKSTSNILFTQDLNHLKSIKSEWEGIEKVLVVSSTSTPLFIEENIVSFLEAY